MLFPGTTEIHLICNYTFPTLAVSSLSIMSFFCVCVVLLELDNTFSFVKHPSHSITITPGTNRVAYAVWCRCRGNDIE